MSEFARICSTLIEMEIINNPYLELSSLLSEFAANLKNASYIRLLRGIHRDFIHTWNV